MVFFFALAAKEVYEAALPGGPLASPRLAAVPLLAAAGGMIAPAALYALLAAATGRDDLTRGWAIPTATDIAFAYLVVRLIFRPDTRRFRSCCCSRSPTTPSDSSCSRSSIRAAPWRRSS